MLENFRCVTIENERDYLKLIKMRIDRFAAGESPLPKTTTKTTKRRNGGDAVDNTGNNTVRKARKVKALGAPTDEELSFDAELETPQERVERLKRELAEIDSALEA